MKLRFFLILYLITPFTGYSGEIDWNRLSLGVAVDYKVPLGDFGTYWNNSPSLGGVARYEIEDRVFLVTTLAVSYHTPAGDTRSKSIPFIWLMNLSGGIQYEIPVSRQLNLMFGIGGDNFTFLFTGRHAREVGSNNAESEVAIHGEAGIGFRFNNFPRFDIYTRYSSIFSYPDQIPVWMTGLYVYL